MFKIYDDANESITVNTLAEVRELTGATDEQISRLFTRHFLRINGFAVLNYSGRR